MSQVAKYNKAVQILKELNCPEPIMNALWLFGMTVHDDEAQLTHWNNLADPNVVEGECVQTNLLDSPKGEVK